MANPDRQAKPDIARTEQGVLNNSFDEIYNVLAVALLGEYNNNLYRLQVDSAGKLKIAAGLVPGSDYDYLDVQQTDSDTETFVFKTGGSGGTTVRTIVVNYTSSAKTDIDNVTWS